MRSSLEFPFIIACFTDFLAVIWLISFQLSACFDLVSAGSIFAIGLSNSSSEIMLYAFWRKFYILRIQLNEIMRSSKLFPILYSWILNIYISRLFGFFSCLVTGETASICFYWLFFYWKKFFSCFFICSYQSPIFLWGWYSFSTQTCVPVFNTNCIKITQIRIL